MMQSSRPWGIETEAQLLTKGCFFPVQRTNLPKENLFVLHDGPPYANGSLHLGSAPLPNETMAFSNSVWKYRACAQ